MQGIDPERKGLVASFWHEDTSKYQLQLCIFQQCLTCRFAVIYSDRNAVGAAQEKKSGKDNMDKSRSAKAGQWCSVTQCLCSDL